MGDDGQGEAVAAFLMSPPSSWQAASQRILGYSCVSATLEHSPNSPNPLLNKLSGFVCADSKVLLVYPGLFESSIYSLGLKRGHTS